MAASNNPEQAVTHGGDQSEHKPTTDPVDTAPVIPGGQPFVRQPVAELSLLSQPGGTPSIEATKDEKRATPPDGSSWRPEMVDRRDLVPWEQRPILQRILDIPDEFKRNGLYVLGRERCLSLEEVKGRALHFLGLTEPEISESADMKFVSLVCDAMKRLQHNKSAYIGDLVYQYQSSGADLAPHPNLFRAFIKPGPGMVEVELRTVGGMGSVLTGPDSKLGSLNTRRILATVIKTLDHLWMTEKPPERFRVVVTTANFTSTPSPPDHWLPDRAQMGKVGFAVASTLSVNLTLREGASCGK